LCLTYYVLQWVEKFPGNLEARESRLRSETGKKISLGENR
jgi:hypothetical protein